MSFADIALSKSMENNRAIKMMERINKVINWRNIEALLLEYYDVGKSKEGLTRYSFSSNINSPSYPQSKAGIFSLAEGLRG